MNEDDRYPQTFVEWVIALLEARFPWLGGNDEQPVSGADVVDELSELHRKLTRQREDDRPAKTDADQ
jgi:hypothetical protein